jgi:molybdenum cofactor guanylyltransferase
MDSDFDSGARKRKEPVESVVIPAAGFVLAGGRSSRMGQNKSLLMLGGEPLVARAIRKLSQVCAEVAIAGGTKELLPFGRLIPDENPGCGPLGGIVAALEQSSFEWNLFLAVDAPFVPVSVLKSLLNVAAGSGDVCAMVRSQDLLQPLCAAYSRRALDVLKKELAAGRWKVMRAIEAAGPVQFLDIEDSSWFINLNTPEDFAEAELHIDVPDI